MKVLLLTTDSYGGHGGIAYYNRCVAEALASMPEVTEVVVAARVARFSEASIPPKVRFLRNAVGTKWRYIRAVAALATETFDLVICGHINLLPLAVPFALLQRAVLVLQVHGIDVWQAPTARAVRLAMRRVQHVWTVSGVTRERMNTWACLPEPAYTVIPNAVDLNRYGLAPPRADLVDRYRLTGRKVVLTLARLSSSERYKGVDELLELLPGLLAVEPTLAYVVVGDGDDLPRLQTKAQVLGVAGCVTFTGYVPEDDKADHLRLADVFALPGRGEGFGIVYLEALACGVPVVGSCLDGSREALREGLLGELANPDEPATIAQAVLRLLYQPKRVPEGLSYFDRNHFNARVATAVRRMSAPDDGMHQ